MRIVVLALLLVTFALAAAETDPIDHFYNLEYDLAIEAFRAAAQREPENPRRHNELSQALFYREMFRSGSLDSDLATGDTPLLRRPKLTPPQEILEEMNSSVEQAITLSKSRLAEEPTDTGALYELGVAHGARANIHFLVRKAWFKGLRDVAKARQLHNRVVELDPKFIDAKFTQGAHDYLISQLPFAYKVAGSIAGFRGNRRRGIETIELVSREGKQRRVTAQLLLTVIYRRENQPERAVPLLEDLIERFPRNYLYPIELAHMHADAGDVAKAIETLGDVEERIDAGAPGYHRISVSRVQFLRGQLLFRRRMLAEATEELHLIFDRADEVNPEIRALAGLRLGQTYDLLDRRPEARNAYEVAILAQPVSEAARLSRKYLLSPYREKDADRPVAEDASQE